MKIKNIALSIVLALFLGVFGINLVMAAVNIVPANGGTGLTEGSGFVTLTNVFINESMAGDIKVGNHVFSLPGGWEFDTASNIQVVTDSTTMAIVPENVTPGVGSFSFEIQAESTSPST